jgi:uncharacterized membrane protein YebE (DUF533 family)
LASANRPIVVVEPNVSQDLITVSVVTTVTLLRAMVAAASAAGRMTRRSGLVPHDRDQAS